MHNNTLQAALEYAERGFSVIPVKPDVDEESKKKSYVAWTPYQTRRATPDEIKSWWAKWPRAMIGIVTGEISGIFVIDCDNKEAYEKIQALLPDSFLCPVAKTPRGWHLWFLFASHYRVANRAKVMPDVDVRTTGGYIIAAPSINTEGKGYEWLDGLSLNDVALGQVPDSILKNIFIYIGKSKERPQETTQDHKDHKMFEYGNRDDSLFSVANALVKGGMLAENIFQVLEKLIISWGEKPDPKWIDAKIKSALQRADRRERNIAAEVREWVETTSGYFETTTNHKELQLTTKEEMKSANMALLRLCDEPDPILEKHGNRRGCYRRIDKSIEFMDFANADLENSIDLRLPLNLQSKTKFFPKAAIVIAGVSGMGKTLFCFNSIVENMGKFPIFYFNSEMGPEALKMKLSYFPIPMSDWAKNMKVIDNWDFNNIADKIQPDAFNVIDYLEPEGDKPYNIHGVISAIIRRLNKGSVLIAIQKKPGATMGTGGIYSIKAATLALALDWGKIEVVKNRFREADTLPSLNKINFEVHQGHKFVAQGGWYK
ncbi:MAG: hypothetical protein GXY72_00210 [Deltaproteobacteria bacterium]|nr:hypothetical protein [Deltaproteobacteria bacterium]